MYCKKIYRNLYLVTDFKMKRKIVKSKYFIYIYNLRYDCMHYLLTTKFKTSNSDKRLSEENILSYFLAD